MADVHHLVYQSAPTRPLDGAEIDRLLERARAANAATGITGSLLVLHDESRQPVRFVQWIEGAPRALDNCFQRIAADRRHADLRVLARGPRALRAYPNWTMQLVWLTSDQLSDALARFGVDEDAGLPPA